MNKKLTEKDLEKIIYGPQTSQITLKADKEVKRATIPTDTRKLLQLQPENFVYIQYIIPHYNSRKYELIYDYQKIDQAYRISINPLVKKMISLESGDLFNVKLSKVLNMKNNK